MHNKQLAKKHYPCSDYTALEISDILEELNDAIDYFPHRAINAAIAKQEEITPVLLDVLKTATKRYKFLEEEGPHILATPPIKISRKSCFSAHTC